MRQEMVRMICGAYSYAKSEMLSNTHTNRASTVTLAAHARRVLNIELGLHFMCISRLHAYTSCSIFYIPCACTYDNLLASQEMFIAIITSVDVI